MVRKVYYILFIYIFYNSSLKLSLHFCRVTRGRPSYARAIFIVQSVSADLNQTWGIAIVRLTSIVPLEITQGRIIVFGSG